MKPSLPIRLLLAANAQRQARLNINGAGPCYDYVYQDSYADESYQYFFKILVEARADQATLTLVYTETGAEPVFQSIVFKYVSDEPLRNYPGCPYKGFRYEFTDFGCESQDVVPYILFLGDQPETDWEGNEAYLMQGCWGPNLENVDMQFLAKRQSL